MKILSTFLAILSLLFPPLPQRGGQVIISPAPVSGGGVIPAILSGQVCHNASSGSSVLTCTLPSNDTSGNAVVVGGINYGNVDPSVPTMTGATFTAVGAACYSGTESVYIYVATNVTGGNQVVTWTGLSSVDYSMNIAEVSGIALASAVDGSLSCNSGGTYTSPATVGPSGTPSTTNEFAFSELRVDNVVVTTTWTNGFSLVTQTNGNNTSGFALTTASAITAKATTDTDGHPFAMALVLLKHQ